jgi:hypothetical protein
MQSQQHGIYMSTASPTSLSYLEVDFQIPGGFLERIKSARWGTWHEPHLLCQESNVESRRLFSWPVKMDIAEATTLLQKAGYTGLFSACSIAFSPQLCEISYIFKMDDGRTVFVGINHKCVHGN